MLGHFGAGTRLARLTTGHVDAHKATRLAAKASPATVKRELATLGRMAALARHQYGLTAPFTVTLFEERNAGKGFFQPETFAMTSAGPRRAP